MFVRCGDSSPVCLMLVQGPADKMKGFGVSVDSVIDLQNVLEDMKQHTMVDGPIMIETVPDLLGGGKRVELYDVHNHLSIYIHANSPTLSPLVKPTSTVYNAAVPMHNLSSLSRPINSKPSVHGAPVARLSNVMIGVNNMEQ